jgi:hypothetical protein
MAATKFERAAVMALTPFTAAAQQVVRAAEESLESARKSRSRIRRQRIISQTVSGVTIPPKEQIDMPADWAADEVTQRFEIPPENKYKSSM